MRGRASTRRPIEDRFWEKVDKSGDCWNWMGSKDKHGYGVLSVENRPMRANRLCWIINEGPIPKGLHVLHTCDNPACVRPDHLFLGTHADNMQDCAKKGRVGSQVHPERYPRGPRPLGQQQQVRGEAHGKAKLNDAVVRRIRELDTQGYNYTQIGCMFNVGRNTVRRVIQRECWQHVSDEEKDDERPSPQR